MAKNPLLIRRNRKTGEPKKIRKPKRYHFGKSCCTHYQGTGRYHIGRVCTFFHVAICEDCGEVTFFGSDFAAFIFETFFAPFWDGGIRVNYGIDYILEGEYLVEDTKLLNEDYL